MTWIDITLIFVFLAFVALGARLGSLWTGACILGGFFGAMLVDTYTLPLAGLMGNFSGATVAASACLYAGGLAAALIPGAVLSQIGSAFILNLFDGAFGLFTGAFAAFFLTALLLMGAVLFIPKFESQPAFRRSILARPYDLVLDEIFSQAPFKSSLTHKKIKAEAAEKLKSLEMLKSKGLKNK